VDIDKKLSEAEYSYEILVVNDGSEDKTSDIVHRLSRVVKNLKLINVIGQHGRGWAARDGMLKSTGNYRLLTDGYNSVSVSFFGKMLPYFKEGFEIVIGSSRVRGILGNLENLMFRGLDFKCFSERAAIGIFGVARINGWGFDIEAMNLARLFNYRTVEVPVMRSDGFSSILSVGKFSSALWDSMRVRFWLSRGKYKNPTR
jgi:dolichyl-phosphate beta-glucosyltransferase